MSLTQEGYQNAIPALKKCISRKGMYASGVPEGYTSVWSRDGNISLLGGALVGATFRPAFKKTLETLAKNQSRLGQIPNAVGLYDSLRKSDVTYNTIDSSLWFIIGAHVYAGSYTNTTGFLKKIKPNLDRALEWVQYRDMSEDGIPEQLPTTDWEDAFPHKYGHTINTQALYYAALMMMSKNPHVTASQAGSYRKLARELQELINGNSKFPHLALYDRKRGYYLPWAWKDHDGDREEEYWFDSLGNYLAIVTGLATPHIAKEILEHTRRARINRPYPVRAISPPIKRTSKLWKSYFAKSDARKPYDYLNGGIWPFIGGFYIAALVKAKQYKTAKKELEHLAEANKIGWSREWEFNEWLSGKTGKPKGGVYQAWSIGMYIYAYECVKQKKVPFF